MLLVIVKDQSSHLLYLNIYAQNNKSVKIWAQLVVEVAKIIMEEKKTLSHKVVCFQMLDFETSKSNSEVSKTNSWKITSFSKNYVTSKGAVSHNVLYHQPLPITRYQARFYANN